MQQSPPLEEEHVISIWAALFMLYGLLTLLTTIHVIWIEPHTPKWMSKYEEWWYQWFCVAIFRPPPKNPKPWYRKD